MAHRTNVTQVGIAFSGTDETSKFEVIDPVCGMKMPKKQARHVLFLGGDLVYFCSRECREKYQVARKGPRAA